MLRWPVRWPVRCVTYPPTGVREGAIVPCARTRLVAALCRTALCHTTHRTPVRDPVECDGAGICHISHDTIIPHETIAHYAIPVRCHALSHPVTPPIPHGAIPSIPNNTVPCCAISATLRPAAPHYMCRCRASRARSHRSSSCSERFPALPPPLAPAPAFGLALALAFVLAQALARYRARALNQTLPKP